MSAACLFGGDPGPASVTRPSSIPTATPPATLPEPILVGETQATNTSPAATAAGTGTYVVKSGDTLGSIAAQHGVAPAQQGAWVQQVLQLNGIADATLLQSGVELRLPAVPATPRPTGSPAATTATVVRTTTPQAGATTAPTQAAAAATPTRSPVTGGGGTYTVVSGDFPLQIAIKLGVPVAQQAAWADQLVALNGINPSALQVGQVLQLPPIPAGAATATP